METEERGELIILAAGVAALILSVWHTSSRPGGAVYGPLAGMEEAGNLSAEERAAPGEKGVERKSLSELKYTGREYRDPLDDGGLAEKGSAEKTEALFPKENFLVSAVIWGSDKPRAIVNSKIMAVGDALDGARIVAIDREGVHVKFGGQDILLAIK